MPHLTHCDEVHLYLLVLKTSVATARAASYLLHISSCEGGALLVIVSITGPPETHDRRVRNPQVPGSYSLIKINLPKTKKGATGRRAAVRVALHEAEGCQWQARAGGRAQASAAALEPTGFNTCRGSS